ncbi:MAG: divalent-cation tolerance protein CutA [Gammaproteobacteria bacterium]|nr:divalent-cation tolerance protein CutA [Gammaproteobacteria bacterium]
MNEPREFCLVLSTCPDEATAKRLAGSLLAKRLAACVNIVPGLRSMYLWKGELRDDAEVLMLIKTRVDHYDRLEAELRAEHPYELPEIVAVPFEHGLTGYFSWINDVVKNK